MPELFSLTHRDQGIQMRGALSLALQTRIVRLRFVDGSTIKISQPSFNSPSRYEHEYALILPSFRTWVPATRGVKLASACSNSTVVTVDHHHKSLRHASTSVFDGLFGKTAPYILRSVTLSGRCHPYSNLMAIPSHLEKEAPHEGGLLLVLTQHQDLDLPAQLSQPRANSSESSTPPSVSSEPRSRPRAVMTPDVSRRSNMP